MSRLAGKRTIVTGAGSGIGRAAAMLFATEGASVLLVDRAEAALAETTAQIRAAAGTAVAVVADTGNEDAVRHYIDVCVKEFGGLDALYANAGFHGAMLPFTAQTVDHWQEVLRINLLGTFLAIKHSAPRMTEQGKGSIVCTASVAGLRANTGSAAYSASKAGVVALVHVCANELYGTGVRVNAVCPGMVETAMTREHFKTALGRQACKLNPLGRAGEPAEIAQVALFLLSDDSSYLNGQAIAVDGGLSSTHPFLLDGFVHV